MADIADGTVSRQKAEYVSHDPNIKRGQSPYIEVTYKHLDGVVPGEIKKAGSFISALDAESKERIKAGGTFVVVKTKVGNYWNLTKVEDVSTYVEKPASTYQKKSYGGGSTGGGTYNTAGIKVGAVLHDAVALYAADGGAPSGVTAIECVKTIAEELLHLSFELEANVNAGKYAGTAKGTSATGTYTAKKTLVVEGYGPVSDAFLANAPDEALDNIDF